MAQALDGNPRSRRNGDARAALKSRATDVVDDLSELKKDMERLADAAGKAARAEVKNASKKLEGIRKNVRTRAEGGASYAVEKVRSHPGAAIGISLGAGVVLGALLLRR